MPFHVTWTRRALKELSPLEPRKRLMIAEWVNANIEGGDDPTRMPSCKRLRGVASGWRWRLGRHRILGRVIGSELVVDAFKVGDRRDACRSLPV